MSIDVYYIFYLPYAWHTVTIFFFKQKTAYEMRISDWSSDVCSSDLDEGADERRREGEDGEQDGPHLQRVALLHHDGGMQQSGAEQPGHEGDVLDRVPEPPAAPAELVVGPPRAERDAAGEEGPGEQRPGPDRTSSE